MTGSSASARDAFRSYQTLTPPRVLTSAGEVVAAAYRRDDLPAGALVGLPVSAGTIEGRARVILDTAEALDVRQRRETAAPGRDPFSLAEPSTVRRILAGAGFAATPSGSQATARTLRSIAKAVLFRNP